MGHFIESKTFSLYLIRKGKIISPLIAVLFDKNLFVFNVTTCKLIFSLFFKQNDSWSESRTENLNWPQTCLVIWSQLLNLFSPLLVPGNYAIGCPLDFNSGHGQGGFPGGSAIKDLPAMQDMWVRSLGWEDPLEKEMATHSSILAWEIPCTEKPGGLQSMGSQKSWTQLRVYTATTDTIRKGRSTRV